MKMFRRIITWTVSFLTLSSASTLLTVDPEKRLKAKISKDSMNRLAFKNDRIINVFGDSESYDIQTEETSGQVFIKPNAENGEKPLSITVMTESNVVQDMLLEPIEKDASTLILTHTSKPKGEQTAAITPSSFGFERDQNLPCFKTNVLKTMKHLVLEQGEETAVQESEEARPVSGTITVKCLKALSVNGMRGVLYEVKNKGDDIADLKPEQFYIKGDLALSLKTDKLSKDQKTYLYAVRS
jgi:type-F conjugative transfer system secretin TraK